MATRTIDLILNLDSKKTGQGAAVAVKSLKQIEEQANKTREKMEKLAQVGTKMALLGGAITAPFILAMKKYVDTAKETEPISKRLLDLNKKWEASQERLGRVTAEIVVPALETAMSYLDKVIDFAEKNPGVVQAALTIGATLVALGTVTVGIAQLASTMATIQGLLAGAGIAVGGGGAAAGAGGVAAGGALAGLAPLIAGAIATWAGANLGLIITNAITGQNYTMTDLGNTAKLILALNAKGLDWLIGFFGGKTDFFGTVSTALGITAAEQARINQTIAENQTAAITENATYNSKLVGDVLAFGFDDLWNGLSRLFQGGKASGGYVGKGFYAVGEQGKEFVMDNPSVLKTEGLLGTKLSQKNIVSAITGAFVYRDFLERLLKQYMALVKAVAPFYSKEQRAAMEKAKYSYQPNDMYIPKGHYKDTPILPGQYPDTYIPTNKYPDHYYTSMGDKNAAPMANNTYSVQVGNGMTITQTRRLVEANKREITKGFASAFGGI